MATYFTLTIMLCIFPTAFSTSESILSSELLDSLRTINNDVLRSCGCTDLHENITKLFVDRRNESATYEDLNHGSLRHKISNNLTDRIFEPRRSVLEDLVKKAEKAAMEYDWKQPIKSVGFKDGRDFNKYNSPSETEPSASRFSKAVNFNFSVVHVPVDIYVGDETVEYDTLRELEWTEELDEAFNFAEESTRNNASREDLMWQYFGSYKGFVRHYPGSLWNFPPDEVDLYDSRHRPWYNRASSPVKEVLILIDTSGSTEGQTIYLSTLAVGQIMATLSEDDYIQVANFSSKQRMDSMNDEARLGPECFPDFVQATRFNKQILLDYVMKLNEPGSSRGQANYDVALEYAFKSFERFDKEAEQLDVGMGTNCGKIIIILTDGGIEKPNNLLTEHDPDGSKYRIFTFAMGQAPTPLDAVKWLACQTNALICKLTHASARGMLIKGLGMLTTLTKPVFQKSKTEEKLKLLGVMCVDIAIDELDRFIPHRELGPLSYAMITNHNGFVVKHPLLQEQQPWHVEPPSVDMLDVEVARSNEAVERIKEVRKSMVDRETKQLSITGVGAVLKNGDSYGYFINHTTEYFTIGINMTAYGLAVVHPVIVRKVLMVEEKPDDAVKELTELKNAKYDVAIAKWRYCDEVFRITNQSQVFTPLTDLIGSDESCDEAMVIHLLWDASIVRLADLKKMVVESDIEAVSLTTAGGLTVSYPEGYYYPEETSSFRFGDHYNDSASKRAFSRRDLFIYSTEASSAPRTSDVTNTITVHKAISDTEDDDKGPYIFGVLGITMNHSVLEETMNSVRDGENVSLCASKTSSCFLLDEGGFILYESNPKHDMNHVGMWLGAVDSSLMHALYNGSDGIYQRHKFYDYQATCIFSWLDETTGSAARIPSLYSVAELFVTQALSALALLYSSIVNYGSGAEAEMRLLEYGERYQVCTKISYQYFYDDEMSRATQTNRTIQYISEDCTRTGVAVRIEETNLLLVIADNPASSCDAITLLPQAPVEIPYEEYVFANSPVCERHLRYRKPPVQCLNPQHKSSTCKACKGAVTSVSLLLAASAIFHLIQ
ncbi:voltage-dependent calcium channel subunit alpha-2/delta-1-like isoform X2 [Watersipora subatra]|uniref:voltage-dependent calcium channel subunit alpha-2/delta-1-like isoform X2 n=1 Tax=Watersipora subatra TaxID=2589382 RepID=UPI00355B4144